MSDANMSKTDLIAKLEEISALYDDVVAIKREMKWFEPEDHYKRKVSVPVFPGEYEDEEEREEWETAIDHENDDAVEQMAGEYDRCYCPREPRKPDIGARPTPSTPLTDEYKKKKGCFPLVAAFVAVCSLISGGLFSGDVLTIILNIVIMAACVVVILAFLKKLKERKAADEEVGKLTIEGYEYRKKEQEQQYEQCLKEYQSLMTSYKLARADFVEEYTKWREAYLASLKEEAEIEEKLEADREAAVQAIHTEKFVPAKTKLDEKNDLISREYLPVIDFIIDLLKSSRADSLKEAVNLYEEIAYRERQLQLQREQEEQRRREEALRREEEERRYQEEKAQREREEYERRYEEERRERQEAERRAEEKKELERQERRAAEDAKREAERKCHWCTNWTNCGMRRNPPLNCTGFRPGSTHQI